MSEASNHVLPGLNPGGGKYQHKAGAPRADASLTTPEGGTVIPLSSRPFESPMTLAVRNSAVAVAPDTSLRPAGADEAEADTPEAVATDPSVIDAERHPLYGHGVECHCKTARLDPDEVTRWGEPYARMIACTRERDRLPLRSAD